MGMCVMYSFCKYEQGPLHRSHELEYGEGDEDSPRSGTSCSSDGSLMLQGSNNQDGDQHPALWKRTIPKGRRCEPLDFSGLILYDEHGNRLHQFSHPSDKPSSLDACQSVSALETPLLREVEKL